ncbi:MAG: putative zinc-binding protein [Candidatus Hodarchaeota archaeon]
MPTLPEKKIGIISCSGEALAEGTISRMATLRVLNQLRTEETVTLCLPLFLAGDERERAFARFYPTIAVDGCEKRCAAHATENYSARPASSIVVTDLITEKDLPQPQAVRQLDDAGEQAAKILTQVITQEIDKLLGKKSDPSVNEGTQDGTAKAETGVNSLTAASCSCGSGFPIAKIDINNQQVKIIALPAIFELFHQQGKLADENTADELMMKVKLYNQVRDEEEPVWRKAILREYADYVASLN